MSRQHRAEGCNPFGIFLRIRIPVWLASQDADKFLTQGANETNFAQLAECGVHFSPQTLSAADQRNVLGGVIAQKFQKAEAALCRSGKL